MHRGGGPLLTGTIEESAAERHPQSDPSGNLTKEVSTKAVKYPSLRADECRRGNPVKNAAPSCHSELVSESVPRYEWVFNIGQTLNQVQGDNGLLVRVGFTMAEILLSLTIIGVVAAITLPSLTGNINERTWNTQRKALYARFSQAIALMPSLNGYGTYSEETDSSGSISITDTVAETFVTAGLSKVLKINNICDSDHIRDCGIASKIVSLKGTTIETESIKDLQGLNGSMVGSVATTSGTKAGYSINNTKAAAFETANGESILVYYVPNCVGNMKETTFMGNSIVGNFYIQQRVCANFIFDLNGNKGPNTVGKDIGFMTAFYPYDAQLVAPYPAINYADSLPAAGDNANAAIKYCSETFDGEYRLAKIDELSSMFVNNKLIDAQNITTYFASSDKQSEKITAYGHTYYPLYSQNLKTGNREETGPNAWCVKR